MAVIKGFEVQAEHWPSFTDAQVEFLEGRFPARCISRTETIEDHIRYAGKVDLIAQMREHVIGSQPRLVMSEDEEEALDEVAAAIAHGQEQQEE